MNGDRHDGMHDRSPEDSSRGAEARRVTMPEVLKSFEVALVRQQAAPARRRRRMLRGAGLTVVLALASGTALAATGRWDPFWDGHHDPRSFVLTPPPELQSASLAVLRRTQDNRDRNELLSAFLQRTSRDARVRLPYVRFLRTLTPTTQVGPRGRVFDADRRQIFVLIPRDLAVRPMRGAQPDAPRGSDQDTGRNWLCAWTVEDNWPVNADRPTVDLTPPGAARPPRPANLADRVTGGGGCATIQDIRTKGMLSGTFATGALYGLVPDGVSTVRGRTVAGQIITAKVENNSFELLAPAPDRNQPATTPTRMGYSVPSGRFKHGTIEWVAADGRVIRRIAR